MMPQEQNNNHSYYCVEKPCCPLRSLGFILLRPNLEQILQCCFLGQNVGEKPYALPKKYPNSTKDQSSYSLRP
uniref:Putative ovule protein n=1 Tax=Solanum chacoense TaxID=4108 RepID=A0A0V0HRA6_SOLCH